MEANAPAIKKSATSRNPLRGLRIKLSINKNSCAAGDLRNRGVLRCFNSSMYTDYTSQDERVNPKAGQNIHGNRLAKEQLIAEVLKKLLLLIKILNLMSHARQEVS